MRFRAPLWRGACVTRESDKGAFSARWGAVSTEHMALEQAKARLRLALVGRHFVESNGLAGRPFVGDVWESFAIDADEHMSYVLEAQSRRWNLGADELHQQGSRALWEASRAIALEAKRPGDPALTGKYLVIATRDGYDAARLAVKEMRDAIAKVLGYPFFAAIPNRDFLIAWSEDYAFSDEFADKVREDFERQGYPISPLVYRVDRDDIQAARVTASSP